MRKSALRWVRSGILILLAVTVACVRAGDPPPVESQPPNTPDLRVTELQAQIDNLEAELRNLEDRSRLIQDSYARSSEGLKDEVDRLRTELYEKVRYWSSLADDFGYRVQGAAYGWLNAPVRACGTRVVGGSTMPHDADVRVGPLVLGNAREYEIARPEAFAPVDDGTYRGHKLLAKVDGGARVLVVVPEHELDNLSLAYEAPRVEDPDRGTRRTLAIAELERAVLFEGCPPAQGPAEFDGGVFVAAARCVDLDVFVDGATEGTRVTLGFGMACP